MTVEVQTPFIEHIGNGVTKTFGHTFLLLDKADLKVYVDGVLQVSGYTVAGVDVPSGGSVTFIVAPKSGKRVLLSRELALARTIDYQVNGALPSATIDKDFDRLWQAFQQLNAQLAGVLGAAYPETIGQLPGSVDRASKFLAFDAAGEPIGPLVR